MTSDPHDQPSAPPVVDARGLACPQPVIDLARAVDTVAVGERVHLWADDPAATVDVPVWCRMRGHRLLDVRDREGHQEFVVERRTS